jgi:hypothetical protein
MLQGALYFGSLCFILSNILRSLVYLVEFASGAGYAETYSLPSIYTPTIIYYLLFTLMRYINLKNRFNSGLLRPSVASSGSLHFAAFIGHIDFVHTFFHRGPMPTEPIDMGDTGDVGVGEWNGGNGGDVGEWLVNKNRDLRERTERDDGGSMRGGMDQKSCDMAALESLEGQVRNRLLHVKQSINHTLDTFKAHSYSGLYIHVHTRTLTSGGTNASTGGSLNQRRIHSTPPNPTFIIIILQIFPTTTSLSPSLHSTITPDPAQQVKTLYPSLNPPPSHAPLPANSAPNILC